MQERIKGLRYLLELNNEVMLLDTVHKRFYSCFEVKEIKNPNEHIPHGIKYNLTLHDRSLSPNETRIFGIDNAHQIKQTGKRFIARKVTWDHVHKNNEIINYEFIDCEQLLLDYWKSVKTILANYDIFIA